MQQILINDVNLDFILEEEKNVKDALDFLRDMLRQNRELFYSITIDSNKILPSDLQKIETTLLDDIDQLAIQTVKIDEIKTLIATVEDISILLHKNLIHEAMDVISRFTITISSLLEAIKYNFDMTDAKLQECCQVLLSKLNQLVESLETNDVILIGDLLEYEISPQITSLIDILPLQD